MQSSNDMYLTSNWMLKLSLTPYTMVKSNKFKDSPQHVNIPSNLIYFVNLCSKQDSQLQARAAESNSQRWEEGFKKANNANNTTSAPEAAPAESVPGYFSPTPMDILAVKGKKITLEERKHQREEGLYMYCGDSRYFLAAHPRKLKAASGWVEVNPFKKN